MWRGAEGRSVLAPATGNARLRPHSIILASCKPGWKPGRKQVESQLRTCLKRVFSTFHLYSTRANQRTVHAAVRKLQVFDKNSLKLVESVSQTRTNLSKTWLQTWSKTRFAARFLQLARIMECDLYRLWDEPIESRWWQAHAEAYWEAEDM